MHILDPEYKQFFVNSQATNSTPGVRNGTNGTNGTPPFTIRIVVSIREIIDTMPRSTEASKGIVTRDRALRVASAMLIIAADNLK
jgi:hypothetical protein